MYLFHLEPGDDVSYRFRFGRLEVPSRLITYYTLFGFAAGNNALISFPFDAVTVNFDTFDRPLDTAVHRVQWPDRDVLLYTAWRVYAALVGCDEEDAGDP